jgi:hypothetical protein
MRVSRTKRILTGALRCAIFAALLIVQPLAAATTELKILATDPAPDVLLARAQPFFVRFELTNDAESAVSVSGRFKGAAAVDQGGVGAPAQMKAGRGVGVVSLFYWGENPTRLDEVRLQVRDARSSALIAEYAFPVSLTWLTDDAPPREPAAWVKEWQRAHAARPTSSATENLSSNGVWLALGAGFLIATFILIGVWRRRKHAGDAAKRG